MERIGTITGVPMFFTELHPNEIVGYENLEMFVAHFNICKSATNSGEFPNARLNKEIGVRNREVIVKILATLRDNGFFPLSTDDKGKIRWGVLTKSQSQVLFEKDLPRFQKMSTAELQKEGRRGYLQIVENSGVHPVNGFELDFAGQF